MTKLLFLFCVGTLCASETIKVYDVPPGRVESKSFALYQTADIQITGKGASFRGNFSGDHKMMPRLFHGWILNNDTHEVVWYTFSSNHSITELRFQGAFDIDENIKLPAGNYSLYYGHTYAQGHAWSAKKLWNSLKKPYEKHQRHEYGLTLTAPEGAMGQRACPRDKEQLPPIAEVRKAGNAYKYEGGFALEAATSLDIYALGEGEHLGRELYDYAWIFNADTFEKVWGFHQNNITHAGGAPKNLLVRDHITLPAGNYKVYYQTDDSHSYAFWNAEPPWDADAWGITIRPATAQDAKNVAKIHTKSLHVPVVELTGVGNSTMLSQGIRLKEDLNVRIYALGERRDNTRLADYGWIEDAVTRETVWEMKLPETEPAGGSSKNRLFNGSINLKKGDYLVCYRTDESHAFKDWNSGKPHQPERWGISLFVNKKDRDKLEQIKESNLIGERLITKIIGVTNDEERQEVFTLKQDSKIRIIAIGEGARGHMADYGWIEDAHSGDVVWEMRYNQTREAGGAYKNRLFNEVISLPKGEYKVLFRTDETHAYMDWNAHAPDNPDQYGIVLMVADH